MATTFGSSIRAGRGAVSVMDDEPTVRISIPSVDLTIHLSYCPDHPFGCPTGCPSLLLSGDLLRYEYVFRQDRVTDSVDTGEPEHKRPPSRSPTVRTPPYKSAEESKSVEESTSPPPSRERPRTMSPSQLQQKRPSSRPARDPTKHQSSTTGRPPLQFARRNPAANQSPTVHQPLSVTDHASQEQQVAHELLRVAQEQEQVLTQELQASAQEHLQASAQEHLQASAQELRASTDQNPMIASGQYCVKYGVPSVRRTASSTVSPQSQTQSQLPSFSCPEFAKFAKIAFPDLPLLKQEPHDQQHLQPVPWHFSPHDEPALPVHVDSTSPSIFQCSNSTQPKLEEPNVLQMVANAVQRRKWRTEPDQIVANAVGQKKRIERYAADFPAFDDAYGNNSATPAKVSPAVERAADLKNFPKISTVYDEPSKLRN